MYSTPEHIWWNFVAASILRVKRTGWLQNIVGYNNENKTKPLIDGRDRNIIRRMVNKTPAVRPNIADVKGYVEGKLFENHYI